MSECPRAGKLFRGCRWRPRYSVSEGYDPAKNIGMWLFGEVPKAIPTKKVYVRDVCETCGKTIERQTK